MIDENKFIRVVILMNVNDKRIVLRSAFGFENTFNRFVAIRYRAKSVNGFRRKTDKFSV